MSNTLYMVFGPNFKEVEKIAKKIEKENPEDVVIYKNRFDVHLRKERIKYYKSYKKANYKVKAILVHEPFEKLSKTYHNKDVDKLKKHYLKIQPPMINSDCDEIEIIASDYFDYLAEIFSSSMREAHNSPYHQETVEEHIKMVNKLTEEIVDSDSLKDWSKTEKNNLITLAHFHDYGKSIARRPKEIKNEKGQRFLEKFGSYDTFIGHENIGAIYYLIRVKDKLTKSNQDIAESIFFHMRKDGMSDKVIRRYNINSNVIKLLNEFNRIDSEARIVFDKELL